MFMHQVRNPQEIAIDFRNQMEIIFGEMQHRVKPKCMLCADLVEQYPQTFPYVGIAPAPRLNSFLILPRILASFLNVNTSSLMKFFRLSGFRLQRLNRLNIASLHQNVPNLREFLNLPGIALITLSSTAFPEEEI